MNIPMEVEHDFQWKPCNPKKQKGSEYSNPRKRRDINLNCTDIVKYLPKQEPKNINTKLDKKNSVIDFAKYFLVIYRYLFYIVDTLLSILVAYLICQIFIFLQKDIMHKLRQKRFESDLIKKEALHNYTINMCDRNTRLPALNILCDKWDFVIKNGNIKYTNVLFEVLGDVCNGFIGRVSFKSITVISLFLVLYLKFRKVR